MDAPCIVYGHQRSGTHYLAALIARNVYGLDDYPHLLFDNHNLLNKSVLEQHSKNIYIRRNREDVLRSVYRLRSRFGLVCDDFDVFVDTPYWEMFEYQKCQVKRKTLKTEEIVTDVSDFFSTVVHTPKQWWETHIIYAEKQSDLLIVDYERLPDCLDDIADYLGEKVITRESIPKVGWFI